MQSQVVWVFNGGGSFPSGVFSTRENAELWIAKHRLNGCLTMYPLDSGMYEWAIDNGYFTPAREYQKSDTFIAEFSCGHVHHHYENGFRVA